MVVQQQREGTPSDLMATVLTQIPTGARHPSSGHRPLTTSGRTVCRQTSQGSEERLSADPPVATGTKPDTQSTGPVEPMRRVHPPAQPTSARFRAMVRDALPGLLLALVLAIGAGPGAASSMAPLLVGAGLPVQAPAVGGGAEPEPCDLIRIGDQCDDGGGQVAEQIAAARTLLRRDLAETATTPLEQARRRHHCPATTLRVVRWPSSSGVEVAGIEPASSRGEPGLLRAQLTVALFSAPALVSARCRQAQYQLSPDRPLTRRSISKPS